MAYLPPEIYVGLDPHYRKENDAPIGIPGGSVRDITTLTAEEITYTYHYGLYRPRGLQTLHRSDDEVSSRNSRLENRIYARLRTCPAGAGC